MIVTLLTVLLLQMNPLDGIAPLDSVATVTIDRSQVAWGRACLIWVNETAPDGLPADRIRCWDLVAGDGQKTWTKDVSFQFPGAYVVWCQVMGADRKGTGVVYVTPLIDVVTK